MKRDNTKQEHMKKEKRQNSSECHTRPKQHSRTVFQQGSAGRAAGAKLQCMTSF